MLRLKMKWQKEEKVWGIRHRPEPQVVGQEPAIPLFNQVFLTWLRAPSADTNLLEMCVRTSQFLLAAFPVNTDVTKVQSGIWKAKSQLFNSAATHCSRWLAAGRFEEGLNFLQKKKKIDASSVTKVIYN